ncbi:exopolysaccharide transport family protein [Rhodoblastus acidophilus]|uniref:Exopolysaccharide transport family protein n=1 Tax=Candidatus Rhodoblastus alkanivorans TaxID=2954117 RepID=A0ABS9Z9T4_9HYPH|nr:exopolysaccharide transport family protein [Candidatus Rhodoblastus alkanivorans]MCI4679820.1 exopolysaccharide transport family protein [Candidatus Rhodoblastus alkanivorans]MCI4684326.1 exopolysaccharide transport family protein [Candidatus Rhodoblastus alkanivorans]MDI4641647.1 exopolysaccharide transport family protein [Rhodoblastus acidophilus]
MSARQSDFEMDDARDEIDLGGVAAALGRRKRLILTATIGAAAAAVLFCLVVKPSYMAESRILVENQETYFTSAAPEGARVESTEALDAEAINSQIQLLTSRDLARRAVKALHLQGNPEFDPAASGLGLLLRPLALLGFGRRPTDDSIDDRLLTNFINHLTVMSPAKTRVLQVEFTSHDPELAARGANTVAKIYIDMKSRAKREDAHQAAQALKPLIASLEVKVAQADARVEAFRARTGLYESSENTSVPTQQLGEIATKLAEARAAQSEALAKAHSLRDLLRKGRLGDAGDIAKNDLVRRIADQRVAVRAQLAAESRTLLPGHPRIKELQAQLSDLDAQLRAAVDKAARGFEDDAHVASARVVNLEALLQEQKGAVGASNIDAAKLFELQRDSKILKDQLASLSSKYQAALARDLGDSAPPDARIISRALAPSQPVFPKKVPITIFAALAGLFFSVAYVIAGELSGGRRQRQAEGAPAPVEAPEFAPIAELKRGLAGFGEEKLEDEPGAAREKVDTDLSQKRRENKESPGFFERIKQVAAEYAAPAAPLDPEEAEDAAPAVALEPEEVVFAAPATPEPEPEAVTAAVVAAEAAAPAPRNARSALSRAFIQRVAAFAADGGAKLLVVSDPAAAPACAALALARALAREGRAILVQIDDSDHALAAELAAAQDIDVFEDAQLGLAQLLSGEASFAETIYRDGASRLHIIQSGGAVSAEPADIDLVLDALQATYDFAIVASGAGPEATRIARDADLTVIYAEDARARDFLSDDFAAAGARTVLLAGRDSLGEIAEMAA